MQETPYTRHAYKKRKLCEIMIQRRRTNCIELKTREKSSAFLICFAYIYSTVAM